TVPALTINRFCSSGLQSIAFAAERVMLGHAEVVIAGGVESMSHVPMTGFRFSPNPRIVDIMPEAYISMGHTAELVAERFGISREDQDRFALSSHQKAARAMQEGKFQAEIAPVEVTWTDTDASGRPSTRSFVFDADEGVRPD